MLGEYILDMDRKPVQCHDGEFWGQWMETADRHVAKYSKDDGTYVSTIFLGLDHNHWGEGPPILYETMVFGGVHDGYQDRYATEEEAKIGHDKAVRLVNTERVIRFEDEDGKKR